VTVVMAFATAYLLGSIPTSYIVVYLFTGRDVRSIGNGNPGAMNVWDNVGLAPAALVAIGDIGKGMAAVSVAYLLGLHDTQAVLAALLAIAGHDYSIFLWFQGGNGTAAAIGGLFALVPTATGPAAAIAVALYMLTGSKRLSGVIALLCVPLFAYLAAYPDVKIIGVLLVLTVTAVKIIRFEGFTPERSRPPR